MDECNNCHEFGAASGLCPECTTRELQRLREIEADELVVVDAGHIQFQGHSWYRGAPLDPPAAPVIPALEPALVVQHDGYTEEDLQEARVTLRLAEFPDAKGLEELIALALADARTEAQLERDEARAALEGRARGCQCGDADVCAFVKERDEAKAALHRLQFDAAEVARQVNCTGPLSHWVHILRTETRERLELLRACLGEAVSILERFCSHYPFGINPDLDNAWNSGNAFIRRNLQERLHDLRGDDKEADTSSTSPAL